MSLNYDPQQVRADYRRDGYVVLRGFYGPTEMAELKREIDRYVREVIPTLPPAENLYEIKGQADTLKYAQSMHTHDPYFKAMFGGDKCVRLAELLLDGPVASQHLSMFNKPPGIGNRTPPHQDGFYFMLDPMEALTLWLAVDPVDEENGCVRYVKGSHLQPMRAHQRSKVFGFSQAIPDYGTSDDLANEVAVHAQPGDMLAHHCLTVHRADANRSDRHRRSMGLVYFAAQAKADRAAIEAYQNKLKAELALAGKI